MKFIPDCIDTGATSVKVAVLSGKGGTGKTLVSVNLAAAAGRSTYIDCDVEEPNGHLFFKPVNVREEDVAVKIPVVDTALCDGCRKCVEFCRFNALAYTNEQLIIFEDICHSCGGCMLVCPQKALAEKDRVIGKVQMGESGDVSVFTGILNPGEASGIPLIDTLLFENRRHPADLTFIDCPPGSACIVMESIKDADYCVLVAEPTLFGVHNLNMVYELVTLFGKPFGVVLNKCLDGENPAETFCLERDIRILGKLPFDSELGSLNSAAKIVARENAHYKAWFLSLLDTLKKEARS